MNEVTKIEGQVRQGDVLIHPLSAYSKQRQAALPKDAVRVEGKGPIVLAFGSATGHSHQIRETDNVAEYRQKAGRRFLDIEGDTTVVHEEHGAIPLRALTTPAEVLIQEEYERGALRQVLD